MKWSAGFSWLRAWHRNAAHDDTDPDRGDMGTAFGLDAIQDEPVRAEPATRSADRPAATRWEARLNGRSSL